MRSRAATLALAALVTFPALAARAEQSAQPAAAQKRDQVTPEQLRSAIDTLGAFDFPVRMAAARTVRRAPPSAAVPALIAAVTSHQDEYVRFRALVLLSAFNDSRARDVMLQAFKDRNDRLRAVAYAWFEHNPDPAVLPRLLAALDKEESDLVRPALTRALSAYGQDAKVRAVLSGLVMKGQDLFRAAVIEALGDRKAAYALDPIVQVAKLDGPLQDDAVLAIGKVGEKRGLETLAGLQRSAPRPLQPTLAAAICLIGSNCASHRAYLQETVAFALGNPGFQELLRAAASGLSALAAAGDGSAAESLIDRGAPARDPERAALALALGTVALRNTRLLLGVLEARTDAAPAVELLRDAFDMLEEDFEEERFFALVRRTYWTAAPGSASRRIAEMLIQRLDF
jgi:HEAT repeat protein